METRHRSSDEVWIRRLARHLVDPAVADDLAQETLLAAWRQPPDPKRPRRPWLRAVMRNALLSMRRSDERRRHREEAAAAPEPLASPEEVALQQEASQSLWRAIERLEQPLQELVRLRYVEGLEPSEIARRQGVPPGTVRWRLKLAMQQLRRHLDTQHDGDRKRWLRLLVPLAGGRRRRLLPASVAVVAALAVTGVVSVRALPPGERIREKTAFTGPIAPAPLPTAAETKAPPAFVAVEGVVIDERDRPVAGAEVLALPTTWNITPAGPAVSRITRTGADGRFRFADLQKGAFYSVAAAGVGFLPSWQHGLTLRNDGPVPNLRLRVHRPEAAARVPRQQGRIDPDVMPIDDKSVFAKGRVTDASGNAVTRAIVAVSAGKNVFSVTTNAEGLYKVRAPATWGPLSMTVTADGYLPSKLVMEPWKPAEQHAVLTREARLGGKVIDDAGLAVPNAQVRLKSDFGGTAGDAVTDQHGRFFFRELRAGRYRLQASAGSLAGVTPNVVTLSPGEAPEVVLLIAKAATVSGRLLDDLGSPLAGFSIEIGEHARGETAKDGSFRLEGVVRGTHLLFAGKSGSAPMHDEVQTVRIEAADVSELEVRLPRRSTITGRVVDASGQAVPSAEVSALADHRPEFFRGESGPDGRFTLHGVVPGRVTVDAEGPPNRAGSGAVPLAVSPGDSQEVLVVLGKPRPRLEARVPRVLSGPGIVAGRILDAQHRPAGGAQVRLHVQDETGARGMPRMTSADEHGGFTFTGVAHATYTLVAEDARHPSTGRPNVKPGQALTVVLRSPAMLAGSVVDERGEPLAAFRIEARQVGPDTPERPLVRESLAIDDPVGAFTFDRLAEGTYDLLVTTVDHRAARARVSTTSGRPIRLQLAVASPVIRDTPTR